MPLPLALKQGAYDTHACSNPKAKEALGKLQVVEVLTARIEVYQPVCNICTALVLYCCKRVLPMKEAPVGASHRPALLACTGRNMRTSPSSICVLPAPHELSTYFTYYY